LPLVAGDGSLLVAGSWWLVVAGGRWYLVTVLQGFGHNRLGLPKQNWNKDMLLQNQ
jgi:hypothetical protein